jgi:hypothetical protein
MKLSFSAPNINVLTIVNANVAQYIIQTSGHLVLYTPAINETLLQGLTYSSLGQI